MKTFTFAFLFALTSSYAGWRDILKSQPVPPLEVLPEVQVHQKKELTLVVVKNLGTTPIYYSGYAKDTPQFFIEEIKNGAWIDTSWAWCGTGMEIYSILPGKTVDLKLPNGETPQRTYTTFSDNERKKQSLVLLLETK